MKWIRTCDRLPEDDCYVIIPCDWIKEKITIAKYEKCRNVFREYIGTDSDYNFPDYWMPLPEPPIEDRR